MSTPIKLAALISLPEGFDEKLEVDKEYTIRKPGYVVTSFNVPIELCTSDHKYLGRIVISRILTEKDYTELTFKVVMLFNEEVSRVYTGNYIP